MYASDNVLLEVKDLKVHFPLREGLVKAVEGVDFEDKAGDDHRPGG